MARRYVIEEKRDHSVFWAMMLLGFVVIYIKWVMLAMAITLAGVGIVFWLKHRQKRIEAHQLWEHEMAQRAVEQNRLAILGHPGGFEGEYPAATMPLDYNGGPYLYGGWK